VNKVDRVQRRFIRYALRTLNGYLRFACIMFIFGVLGGKMNSPNLLSAPDLNLLYDIELRVPPQWAS
jgi:hypothetical protein